MEFLFPMIWMLGVTFSVYEMTMHSKGHYTDKIRKTYKSEGDGLYTAAIFRKNT